MLKEAHIKVLLMVLCLGLNTAVFAGLKPTEPESPGRETGQQAQGVKEMPSPSAAEAIQLDEKQLKEKFEVLDRMESYVESHPEAGTEEVEAVFAEDLQDLEIMDDMEQLIAPESAPHNDNVYFLMGCLLGFLGVLLAYLAADGDRRAVKWSIYGLLASIAFGGVAMLAIFGLFASGGTTL